MEITPERPVAILGCGLAGLTAASYLARHGVPFQVYEAGKIVGGLARSETDEEGFTYDFGAHFITNRLAAAVGISSCCRDMVRYGESVWQRGRAVSYPFGLMSSPTYVASALAARLGAPFSRKPVNAAEAYGRQYGKALSEAIALPLTEAWSGMQGEELAPSVAEKFANSLARTAMLKAAGWQTGRTVAIGYSGTVRETPHVWHVYPVGGLGTVCQRLADEVGDCISLESPVEAIHVEEERVVGIRAGGRDVPVSAVVSTAPIHVVPRLIRGSSRLAHFARFRFRAMVFVNIKLEGNSGLPNVVTWVPERDFPFFRLSDIGAGLPWLVPAGKSLVTCDIGCDVGDAHWKASDEDLGRECATSLDRIVPGTLRRYLGARVMRTALAYPIFKAEYEMERLDLLRHTGIDGLFSVGRNGEFSHALMEDVFWRTRRKILPLIEAASGTSRASRSAA